MSARPGGGGGSGKGFFWYGFIYLMEAVPVPGGGSFATVSERSEYRSILERQEVVVRNGARRNGG